MTASLFAVPLRTASPLSSEQSNAAIPAANCVTSQVRLYRLRQVLERIPVSRSAWYDGVSNGRYPRGYSLGPRTTVWRSDDIDHIIETISAGGL
jgi:prophage regulatory protein